MGCKTSEVWRVINGSEQSWHRQYWRYKVKSDSYVRNGLLAGIIKLFIKEQDSEYFRHVDHKMFVKTTLFHSWIMKAAMDNMST